MKSSNVTLLIVFALAAFALWFFSTHHKVEDEVYVGPHGEARFNEHLAARLLFHELDFDAESIATLTPTEWMPDIDDTLFLRLNASMTIGQEQEALLDWLSNGGNLVLLPPRQAVLDTDQFLQRFGLRIQPSESSDVVIEDGEMVVVSDSKINDKRKQSIDEYQLVHTWSPAGITITDPDAEFTTARVDGQIAVARRLWGDGYVTLFAEDYFSNDFIGQDDNGRFLLDVVAGDVEPNKIWMVYQTTFSPLWELIWQSAPYLVISLFIIFLLWLWSVMPAFGPRVVATRDTRRSIIEHISAAGVFVWRRNGGDALARSAGAGVVDQAEKRHLGLSRLAPQQQARSIAHITGMSAQKVMDILGGPSGHRSKDFTHNMQELQSIRKQL